MRRLSTTAAVLITAVLGALLAAYVFAGGGRREDGTASRATCSSREALDLVKHELFRRAAKVRNADDGIFGNLHNYSVVRVASRVLRRTDEDSGTVACAAAIIVELPPGVEVVGGRRSLGGRISYSLTPGSGESWQLRSLNNADAIVVPLASVAPIGSKTGEPLAAAPAIDDAAPEPAVPQPPQAAAPAEPVRKAAPAPKAAPVRKAAPAPAAPQPRRAPAASSPPPRQTAPSRPSAGTAAPPAPAAVRPSFNCRYAKTRGEVAVCSDPVLASLDRQMAAQFYSAMRVATPGARAMLQRSRRRFLAHRDSCGSNACVADAYHGRMREISAIMSGRY